MANMNMFEDFIGYQSSTVLDEPEREAGTTSIPIPQREESENPDVYNKCLSVTRKDALVALNVPTSRQNKLRAIVMWLCPPLIPFLLKIREKKSKVIITHR